MAQQARRAGFKLADLGTLKEDEYAQVAEILIKQYMDETPSGRRVTMTKLRSVYSLIANVYTRVTDEESFERDKADIQYIRVRMAYAAGRDQAVKAFLDKTRLMEALKEVMTYDQFKLYCRYAESIVAYFKYYGGKD